MAEYDEVLTWVVVALLSIGLVMVYSASIATAEESKFTGFHPAYFLIRHSLFILVGLIAGMMAFQVPVQTWQKLAPYLFLFGVALLVLVLIPGIGRSVNGSRRWLSLVVINLQPSELMKLFAVLYAADYTVRKGNVKHTFVKAFLPMFAVMVLVGSLLLTEPDMGAFVVICAIALCTLWLGGFNLKVFRHVDICPAARVCSPDSFVALSDAASDWFHGSVVGSLWQGLPVKPCPDCFRAG